MSDRPNFKGHRRFGSTPSINARRNTATGFRASKLLASILTLAFLSTLAFGFARPIRAAIVRQIPFSASLKSPSSGVSVPDGNYAIVFSLYAVETGGVAVYTESHNVGVTNGVVSVNIGSITPIPTSVDFNNTYYLGITVGADAEMAPRRKIGSVPAAFNSSTVDGRAPGVTANTILLLDGSGNINIQGGIATAGMLSATGVPVASGATSLMQLGSSIIGGAAGGTYVGINTPGGFTGDFLNYQVNGTSMFKIAADGTVTTNSVTTIGGNLNVQGNVLPTTTGTYDLGSASKHFANLYVDNLVAGSSSTSGTSSSSFTVNDDAPGDENSALNFYRGGVLPSAQLLWNSGTGIFNFSKGVAITGALTATSINGATVTSTTFNGATISGGTLSGGSITGGTYSNTGLTASGAYTLLAQGGAINLQPSTGIVALNTANANNELRVYENAGTPTNYISLKYDGSGGLLSTNTGSLQIGSSGDVTLSSGVNLKVLGTPPASTTNSLAQLGGAISGGNANGTYLSANSGSGFTGDFAHFLLNGTSKFRIDSSGNVNIAGTLTGIASNNIVGQLALSSDSAASTPTQILTGNWFASGTATTTKPHFLIEPTGTTSTAWSMAGTGLGINAASSFTGRLVDVQSNGASLLRLTSTASGTLALGPVSGGGNLTFVGWNGGTYAQTITSGNGLHISATNNSVAIGTSTVGVSIGSTTAVAGGGLNIVPGARTTGSPNLLRVTGPADTTLTASTEASDVNFSLARTVQFATGALTTQRAVLITAPTYAFVGASTLTNADTVNIAGIPVAGTNATISGSSALRIPVAPHTSTNVGLVSLGSGNWDGSTSGFFAGSASGTVLAINPASGFAGNLVDFQVAGVYRFAIDASGHIASGESLAGVPTVGVDPNSGTTPGDLTTTSGPLKPSAGAGLTLNIAAGSAYSANAVTSQSRLSRCNLAAGTTLAMTDNATNFVYVTSSGAASSTGITCAFNKQTTVPAFDASKPVLILAKVITSGGSITSVADTRFFIGGSLTYATTAAAADPGTVFVTDTSADNQIKTSTSAADTGVMGIVVVGNTASGRAILMTSGSAWTQSTTTAVRSACGGTSTTAGAVKDNTAAVTVCVGRIMTNAAAGTPSVLLHVAPN